MSFFRLIRNSRFVQKIIRHYRPYSGIRPDWQWLVKNQEWIKARSAAQNGPKVLIVTSTGSNWPCSAIESVLGVALTLRGANVQFLLCDGVLPACQECDHQWLSERSLVREGANYGLCAACFSPAKAMLDPLGLPVLRYGQYLADTGTSSSHLSEQLEQHALAGVLRYYGRGTLPIGKCANLVMERYLEAARITATVINRLLQEQRPDVAVFHHGIYVPQGVVGAELRDAGVRLANWGPAYRKSTVLFSHGDTYHHTMTEEDVSVWGVMPWSAVEEAEIMAYLQSRWTGGNDWITFQSESDQDSGRIAATLGLDPVRPLIGLLTNVIWDAQLHFRQSAFPTMLDWLFASIDYFIKRNDLQLVIRIHPAEVKGTVPSRQRVADEIAARYGVLPQHIKIVMPDDKVSTYALMALCDSALVFGTKTALELACTGLPVVVAGEAWSRGKGFTVDVSDPGQYREVLDSLPFARRLNEQQITLARKYAYHFFFRRMIPLRCLTPATRFGPYKVKLNALEQLMPGYDRGLDVICEGILSGSPFIYEP